MPKSQHQKQKKQMKKRRKQQARKKEMQQSKPLSSRSLIKKASQFPLKDCLINESWQDPTELTRIVITREQPDGLLVFGSFLVDMMLLGVKDAHAEANLTTSQVQEMLPYAFTETMEQPCDVALAHQIIYQSIDYAAQYTINPHKDFKLAKNVLDARGTHPETYKLTFGKDGKPFFISGPYDNVKQIINKLDRTAGKGNYDYIAQIGSRMVDNLTGLDDDTTD